MDARFVFVYHVLSDVFLLDSAAAFEDDLDPVLPDDDLFNQRPHEASVFGCHNIAVLHRVFEGLEPEPDLCVLCCGVLCLELPSRLILSVLIPHEVIKLPLPVINRDTEFVELSRDVIVILPISEFIPPSLNLTWCYIVKVSRQA